ncbi:MAG TPA: DUF2294 domain-containing protein [Thermoleophilaceae bacterium]|nr:DUF2294 domain-containing protein [Thermoleophilaceae bacterium]
MSGLQQPAPKGHDGEGLLGRISTEMVQLMKQYYGKGPTKAKSYFLDDFLIVVMRGGTTRAEQTMLEADREDTVREFRQQFENEMTGRMTELIEELTGRRVINYQSQILFDPDISVELFFFEDVVDPNLLDETTRALA